MTKGKETKILVQEAIRELLSDEEFINKIVNKITHRLEEIEKKVDKNVSEITKMENKIVNIQQNEKMNNVCLYNLVETTEGKLQETVLEIFNNKVKVPTKREDIDRCYRVGNRSEGKTRPVVIKFANYNHKVNILKNAYNLKGTKLGLAEELVRNRLEIYKEAVEKFSRQKVFTRSGNVYIRSNGANHRIMRREDLENLPNDTEDGIVAF